MDRRRLGHSSWKIELFSIFFPEMDGTSQTLILCGIFLYYFFVFHRRQASAVTVPLRSAATASTISHSRSTGISSQSDLGVAAVFFVKVGGEVPGGLFPEAAPLFLQ